MQQSKSLEQVEFQKGEQRSVEVLAHDSRSRLNSSNHLTEILPSDPVFSMTKNFWKSLHVNEKCLKNHIRLMAGYQQLPVTLLLNPCRFQSGDFHDIFWQDVRFEMA